MTDYDYFHFQIKSKPEVTELAVAPDYESRGRLSSPHLSSGLCYPVNSQDYNIHEASDFSNTCDDKYSYKKA